jgi:di/tricarboxylate transporter
MPFEISPLVLTLGVVLLALVGFVVEWFPVDITALMVAVVLMLLGLVTPAEGISGFSNPATITVMAMFILSAGIARTGVIQGIGNLLMHWGGKGASQQILVMGAVVAPISAFINNTAVVAVFMPIVEDWCSRRGISSSKLLMPLSYAAVMGGMITLIGTSTNLLASDLSGQLGYGEFSLFQFTVLGVICFVVGMVYLALVVPWLLRSHPGNTDSSGGRDYGLKDYVSEVVVTPRSKLIGQTLRDSQLQRQFDVDVLELIRDGSHFPQPVADKVIQPEDILLVRGSREDLLKIREESGLEILPDVKFALPVHTDTAGEEGIAEILILSNARLVGTTLKELRFRQRYNVTVLAIRRGQELVRSRLGQVPLKFGDLLLVQGPKDSLRGLQTTRELLVLAQRDVETLRRDKAAIALAIGFGVVFVAVLDWMPILVSALAGVALMVITGCLKPGEIYGAVRWDVIFLLAGLIPLGIAMQNSGATDLLATQLAEAGGALSGYWVLALFYLVTSLLTEILSNNAAVVLMIPVAGQVGQLLGLNPLAFMYAVTFAASNSFMTPIGYQTNTMVYGAGGYRFMDFVRIGGPLNLIMAIITPLLIIWIYGI